MVPLLERPPSKRQKGFTFNKNDVWLNRGTFATHLCRTHALQVREAKGVIEATNAEFPAAQLKLIHSGKILKDESTLEEYQIKEDDFLVCMVTKVRFQEYFPICVFVLCCPKALI